MSPTGSIVHSGDDAPPIGDPYRLVAVEPGMAWLRNSVETRVVKTGDFAPGLGRVAAIVERQGRWTLLDETGAALLAADLPAAAGATVNPFSRRMISSAATEPRGVISTTVGAAARRPIARPARRLRPRRRGPPRPTVAKRN